VLNEASHSVIFSVVLLRISHVQLQEIWTFYLVRAVWYKYTFSLFSFYSGIRFVSINHSLERRLVTVESKASRLSVTVVLYVIPKIRSDMSDWKFSLLWKSRLWSSELWHSLVDCY
jgi:hypothetical protein